MYVEFGIVKLLHKIFPSPKLDNLQNDLYTFTNS